LAFLAKTAATKLSKLDSEKYAKNCKFDYDRWQGSRPGADLEATFEMLVQGHEVLDATRSGSIPKDPPLPSSSP